MLLSIGCRKKILPRLYGCCEGAVNSIISDFIQLHRSGFNVEFETLYDSNQQMVADLWLRKDKIVVASNTALLGIVLQQGQNNLSFQGKSSTVVLKLSLNLLRS